VVVAHLAKQVDVPAELYPRYDWSGRTIEYHRAQIRAFLGFRRTISSTGCMPEHVVTDKASFYPTARHTATGFYNPGHLDQSVRTEPWLREITHPAYARTEELRARQAAVRALDALQLVEREFVQVPPVHGSAGPCRTAESRQLPLPCTSLL
jgi:hypothetical protein